MVFKILSPYHIIWLCCCQCIVRVSLDLTIETDKQPSRSEWSPSDHTAVQIQPNSLQHDLFIFFPLFVHHSGLSQHPGLTDALLSQAQPEFYLIYLSMHASLPTLSHTHTPTPAHRLKHTLRRSTMPPPLLYPVSMRSYRTQPSFLPNPAFYSLCCWSVWLVLTQSSVPCQWEIE